MVISGKRMRVADVIESLSDRYGLTTADKEKVKVQFLNKN